MSDPVLYERTEHRLTITLNRPEQRNALTDELFPALEAALVRASKDDARVLVIKGRDNAFCAGADLSFLGDLGNKNGGPTQDEKQQGMVNYYKRFLQLATLPMPTIACVNGFAIGAGFALMLAADIRIAATEAKMGATFAKLGIPPGGGTTLLLPRLVGLSRAFELFYTGRIIDGTEAERIGLVSRAVPRAELDAAVDTLANEIAASAPQSVRWGKKSVLQGLPGDLETQLRSEALGQVLQAGSHDAREGVAAVKEKRRPTFTGDVQS